MTNIEIANSFFNYYESAAKAKKESDKVRAYKGMHQYLDENVVFADMAYENIKGKQVFAMWHWFCTKKPEPVKVTFSPSETREENGTVKLTYRAQYLLGYDENDPAKKGKPIDYEITSNMKFKDGKITHHKDEASIREWTKQAKGTFVSLLSWTSFVKKRIRHTAKDLLDDFMRKNGYM